MRRRFLFAAALCLSLASNAAAQQPKPPAPADPHAGHGAHAD
jgi:Spy/CpxP family protein refolding chaperone